MSPQYPQALILKTTNPIGKIWENMSFASYANASTEEQAFRHAIDLVFTCLQYEREALFHLQYEIEYMKYEMSTGPEAEQAVVFADLLYAFGKELHEQLVALGVYCRGYLPYQFHGKLNKDEFVLLHLDSGNEGEPA